MEEIVQRVRFEETGIDGINAAIADMTKSYQAAEKAKEGAFAGLADQAKAVGKAATDTASGLDNASTSLSRWEIINKSAGKELKSTVDRVKIFGVELGTIRQRVDQAREKIASFGKTSSTAGKAAAAGGRAAAGGFSIARVGAIALQVAMGPIGLILAAVAAAIGVLTVAAQRSQPVMDAIGVVTTVVTAAFDVFLDRISNVGEALFAFASGDFSGGFDKLKDSVSGINEELREEIALAAKLAKSQQDVDRQLLNVEIRRSAANKQLKELNDITEDTTKSYGERKQALEDFFAIEKKIQADEEKAYLQQLAILAGFPEVTDEFLAGLKQINDEGFDFSKSEESLKKFSNAFDKFGSTNTTLDDKNFRAFVDTLKQKNQLDESRQEATTTQRNKRNSLDNEFEAKRLKAIETQKKAEQDLAGFRKQLADQLTQLAIDESEGTERIELERRVAIAQIDELERVTREKFKAAKEVFDLEQDFADLRAGVDRDAAKRSSEFRVSESKKEIEARRDASLARLELETKTGNGILTKEEVLATERNKIVRKSLEEQRAIALKEFGAGSVQVLTIDVQIKATEDGDDAVSDAFVKRNRDAAIKAIDERKKLRLAELEVLEESGKEELSLEQFKEREKKKVLIDALVDRRKILLDQFKDENAPEIKLVDLEIQGLQQQVDGLNSLDLSPLEKIRNGIKKAFNIDDETLDLLTNQAKGAFDNIVSGLEAIYERQLIENDRLIAQIDERVETLQSALDEELSLQEQGLANNAGLAQRNLDEELARKEAANEQRLAIERKAARQQLIIDAAQQASSLALATANLLANEALKGLPGIIIAGTLGAALIFSTIAKAKAQAAQFSTDIPTFRGGGTFEGMLAGPSHEGGGILGHYTQGGQVFVAEMEGGEHVTPKAQSQKYKPFLEAMRTDKIGQMSDAKVLSMLGRNPVVGISQRSLTYHQTDKPTITPEQAERIIQAIQEQKQPVIDANGDAVFVDPSGKTRPYKRKLHG